MYAPLRMFCIVFVSAFVVSSFFCFIYFFCFKQKTAYEMRISDWSSDVCSSDLCAAEGGGRRARRRRGAASPDAEDGRDRPAFGRDRARLQQHACGGDRRARHGAAQADPRNRRDGAPYRERDGRRSEEHTSELQSLMRISYAVFCLKKKTKHT